MSETLRHSETARPRLVGRHLALVFAATLTSLTGFFLLMSVVPMYARTGGAGEVGAGLATGTLMLTTVLAELALPRLIGRFGHRTVLAVGLVLLGLPPLALTVSDGMPMIIAVSLVRGLGFAVAVVVTGAMAAALVPPERRGEGLGLYGITTGAPSVLALPLGVWLAERVGYAPVFVAGAVLSLAALAFLPGLPGRAGTDAPDGPAFGIGAGLRSAVLVLPAVAFAATSMASGVLITFLPAVTGFAAAALFVQAGTTTFARWWAGRAGDRHGAGRLLPPAVALAAAGIALLVLAPNAVAVFAAMVLFGAGFGVAQNASLAMMYERVPLSGYGTVSAIWNIGFDGGMGVGGAAFGIAADRMGYSAAFAATAVLIVLVLPAARRRG
ncbi:MFS transporter [Actinomadura algeriensis]|uniref:MFS family arabinose efflux permease n=1 Tax=Actinomadura algeriensis TaxID=1679523 RepID=A0ABR9JI70_9ACTN|nr:MFS transporter [Actinomadura algeriensis]MBE1530254.1 putative MFS family arabinose efflux permease [Actinomadura algeriensis]